MSTLWDEFLDEHDGKFLPQNRRDLLRSFYLWLVERGVIHD